jgi:hypothetical protein
LKPALEHVASGRYSVRVRRLTDTGAEGPGADGGIRVGDDASTTIAAVDPGIYRMTLEDQGGEPVGVPAIVLVLDESDRDARTLWKDAVAQAASWSSASQGTIDSALVRVLFALNERRKRG